MCSEHITFVWVVDRRNLITVGRVWSSQYSYTVCLASADHPHEAFGLIGSLRMLVRDWTLLMADIDRTPSILICRLLGCFGSLAKMIERLMMLSLKFCGLMTLVAHVLTSRTLSQNPRVHSEETCAHLFLSFLSFSFFFHAGKLSHATLLSQMSFAHALSYLLFKMMQDRIFAVFLPRELNSNTNQLIPIHSRNEKRGVWALLCVESLHEKLFLV